ncbi:MAG: DUF368 domain-containing protein [Eubacterium sp.]|nr:DUF368 domain-containing protein [Eubacterium sp.]
MLKKLLNIIYGAIFGIANVIPGVSGGTMMVVFGVYDKLIEVLSFKLSAIKKNIVFLVFFGIGAVAGILGFSFVITWLFENYNVAVNMFFMGLIAGSIPLIVKTATAKEKFKPYCLIAFIPALALVVGLTVLDNMTGDNFSTELTPVSGGYTITVSNNGGYDMKSNWQLTVQGELTDADPINCEVKKIGGGKTTFTGIDGTEIKAGGSINVGILTSAQIDADSISLSYTYKMNVLLFLTLLCGAALAAVAMIIPGVSGSFVMVLLGIYSTIIGAVKSLDVLILIPTAIGVVIGVVFGAKLISALMKKYSLIVYSAILGLVAGSFYAVLPNGIGLNTQTFIGVVAFIVGGIVSLLCGKYAPAEETAA